MADDSLTHKDLAQALGVSETTIKSYRRKFPGCLPVVSRGKPLRFDPKAMEVCRAIREGFRTGLPVEDLRRRLAEAYAWCAPRSAASGSGTVRAGRAESGSDAGGAVLAELVAAVRDLVATQQGVSKRLEALETRLGGLDERLEAALVSPPPDKVVRIRTRRGTVEQYGLSRMGQAQEGREGDAPPVPFLALPMVIRSDTGEFLGITGSEGHLSIEGFRELMRRKAGSEQPLAVRWERLDQAWVMHLGGPGNGPHVQAHTLHLEQTTTPRGNEVVWLKSMLVADDPMSDEYLHRFLRQLRKDFD